ncbi:MAG: antibiotic biosynthesis monooxygenase, partial [Desulfobacterales bacterium]|nr:antibiotic biosynthesis monooxygenase [Desulfobacterales bacterium]
LRTDRDEGYSKTAAEMMALAAEQPGFLGVESAREGLGITVSYWSDMESIRNWKTNAAHKAAQKKGKALWYSDYRIRISKVEESYG